MIKNFVPKLLSVYRWLFFTAIALSLVALPMSSAQAVSLVIGPDWEQVNVDGFGDPLTVGVSSLEIFRGQLYAAQPTGIQADRFGVWEKMVNGNSRARRALAADS